MKNSLNNNENYVPSMAEPRFADFDDLDNPLKSFKVIPEEKKDYVLQEKENPCNGDGGSYVDTKLELLPEFTKPSSLREEPLVTITVPSGIHPITLIKPEVINHAWIILSKDVVEKLREFSYKFKQNTIAYGEFFRLENDDSFYLQRVEHFDGWRVLRECQINGETFRVPECPEFIIEMTIE